MTTQTQPRNRTNILIQLIVWGPIGFFIFLNVQPWINVASKLAGNVKYFPVISWLYFVPIVGAAAEWITSNFLQIGGVLIWAFVQFIQVAEDLIDVEHYLQVQALKAAQLAQAHGKNKSVDRIIERMTAQFTKAIDDLRTYRWVAYAVETVVVCLTYPIYDSHSTDLWRDLWMWDSALFNWPEIGMALLTMFLVEGLVKVGKSLSKIAEV